MSTVASKPAPAPAILPDLVHCVRDVFQEFGGTPRIGPEVAVAIQPFLGHPRLLAPEHCEPDPTHYKTHLLHAEDDGAFSIVALVWMPGQKTPVHDHLSWCVIGVHQGAEQEVRFQLVEDLEDAFLVPVASSIHPVGSVEALTPPGDIHYVANPGPGIAISLHVYGLDIRRHGSSIRRSYPPHMVAMPAFQETPERQAPESGFREPAEIHTA
jgi:predicted metal-dependent enzyme (double-stranded beta helix superfamily)